MRGIRGDKPDLSKNKHERARRAAVRPQKYRRLISVDVLA